MCMKVNNILDKLKKERETNVAAWVRVGKCAVAGADGGPGGDARWI